MGEEIAFENGQFSDFQGLVTLTLDHVTLHTLMHHSSTSTYIPNFIEIEETSSGQTYGRTFETYFIMSTQRTRPKNAKKCSQNFQFVRPQAVITPQSLRIAENSRPNGPCTGCLLSTFKVRMNPVFPRAVRCAPITYLPKHSAIVDGHHGRLAESWCKGKQTDVGVAAVRRCFSK